MTPAKAIKFECKCCMGGTRGMKCDSEVCKLNNKSLSPLKRIKAHCLGCVETRKEVKDCTGKLLSEDRLCYLHPYRFGHNPKRKGIGNCQGNPKFLQKTKNSQYGFDVWKLIRAY
ncbi:MAG: hypothetical protein HZA47_04920 [Planctomycetes bacterium]|uniref:hypothetical protein n=1 Tax=Candidatus Wunengus sp. YC65 TaxID=3367701 RepID=UPI001D9306B9|nr:hypothetical protein [Planctomycetota bacterium]MBI5795642.1 hypothetical protein [Planctomycetota bacterium]